MANKYWVGGTGNWSDATNHWATSSGGSPGVSNSPTSSDNVFIDTNSGFGGGGTLSIDGGTVEMYDLSSQTGHSYSWVFQGNSIGVYGSILWESSATVDTNGRIDTYGAGNHTITTAGQDFDEIDFMGTGTYTLQDNLTLTNEIYMENGTLDANNYNVTTGRYYFYADTNYTPTIIMGSGTWETKTTDGWTIDDADSYMTITPETSTVKLSTSSQYFSPNYGTNSSEQGQTYNNLWVTGGDRIVEIRGSNTFNELKIDGKKTIKFSSSSTTTVSIFNVAGTADNLITITSTSAEQHTLSKLPGTVSCNYLDIANSVATGGATWYAGANSVNSDNNSGWIFESAPTVISPFPSFKRQ